MSVSRVSRDTMLMEVAHAMSSRGTCSRLQVGAVFSRDGRIVSTGYNGAPAGLPHCTHNPEDRGGCEVAVHAEQNAIAWAARHGLALEGTEVHVTHMPCISCARSLINAGVVKVIYDYPYRLTAGVELLEQAKIEVLAFDTLTPPMV